MSANVASGGLPGGALPGFSLRRETSQMPERSGLPSEVRGVGALRFTLPSGPLGTVGCGYLGHCANTEAEKAATMTAATVNHRFIEPPVWLVVLTWSQSPSTRRDRTPACAILSL